MKNRKLYPENWNDEIRPLILKRDNYKCKKCKVSHRSKGYYDYAKTWVECDSYMIEYAKKLNFKIVTQYLQVHHKDGNTQNNIESNLITLCQRCHLETERELNKLKKKMRGIIYK